MKNLSTVQHGPRRGLIRAVNGHFLVVCQLLVDSQLYISALLISCLIIIINSIAIINSVGCHSCRCRSTWHFVTELEAWHLAFCDSSIRRR